MTTPLLPADWDPKLAGDRVLTGLRNICRPEVKGAHDSDFTIIDGKAYIIYMANEVRDGEAANWPYVYDALTVVDLATGAIEQTQTFAASEMTCANAALPVGACFVPRLLRVDARTLRCFFASEQPGERFSQTWYRDYDLATGAFSPEIHPATLRTPLGAFPMGPKVLHDYAVTLGYTGPLTTYGLYLVDGIKEFDGRPYTMLNNFPNGPSALAQVNAAMDGFDVLGVSFQPNEARLSETALNRLPDGAWLAITRVENGDYNYLFTESRDGVTWTAHAAWPLVPNGANSKPSFDRFGDLYYLGWQEATRIDGVYRSVFNIDISRDGRHWQRKYRFETPRTFQYPVFRADSTGAVYLTVTQGDDSESRKERIMFGRLE